MQPTRHWGNSPANLNACTSISLEHPCPCGERLIKLHVPELLPSSLARASEVLEQGVPWGHPGIELKVASCSVNLGDARQSVSEGVNHDCQTTITGSRAKSEGRSDSSRWSAGCGFHPGRRWPCLHADAGRFRRRGNQD